MTETEFLRIHEFLPETEAEGPGRRACIWVQGCPIRCTGCFVPWTWDSEAGERVGVAELSEKILNGPNIEGVTFVGGEPFAQAASLARLGGILRASGLSVVTFTGYEYENILRAGRSDWVDLLRVTDLLLDGPFVKEAADISRPWLGSSNQRFIFLTDRYRHLAAEMMKTPNRVEIRIGADGRIAMNGMPPRDDLKRYLSELMD